MNSFKVDPVVLEGITTTLRGAAQDLDKAGETAPRTPDAGDATPAIAAIMAQLVDNAGQLVLGLAAASDAVANAGTSYLETDSEAADRFAGAPSGTMHGT